MTLTVNINEEFSDCPLRGDRNECQACGDIRVNDCPVYTKTDPSEQGKYLPPSNCPLRSGNITIKAV